MLTYHEGKHYNSLRKIEDGGAESEKKKTNENSDETNSTDSEGEHILRSQQSQGGQRLLQEIRREIRVHRPGGQGPMFILRSSGEVRGGQGVVRRLSFRKCGHL